MQRFEHRSNRRCSCSIGNDEENGFVSEFGFGASAIDDFGDLKVADRSFFRSGELK
jgi:hypothetical protein